ncbi:Thioredoxin-like protein isoform 3 [Schistosoma japonicum]|uniref:Thioredoxin-like protein isoform 3 n=1 Tax=Schistosoma japonicum TaxID=6182 RepID=A0A4Z2CNZ6_SCHJA|nr:Thioredoxin-like protein isoform 3 [Schistosoma japonicum]
MATVINITDKNQLEQILQEAKNVTSGPPTTVVMDFYASWCRPCSEIAPIFKELSTKYTNMKFIKIDVDKLEYDMDSLLSKGQCECLNEEDSHSLAQLLNSSGGNNSKTYLLSDTDEQLIIYITFSQFVRIQSIQINGPKENAPKTVKLFINQISTPDFDSCEIGEAVQTLELTEDDIKDGGITQLNFVKFQNVNTLTIFVKNNQSSTDQTRIDKLKFYGYPVNTVNMKEFQRVSGKKGEAHG